MKYDVLEASKNICDFFALTKYTINVVADVPNPLVSPVIYERVCDSLVECNDVLLEQKSLTHLSNIHNQTPKKIYVDFENNSENFVDFMQLIHEHTDYYASNENSDNSKDFVTVMLEDALDNLETLGCSENLKSLVRQWGWN